MRTGVHVGDAMTYEPITISPDTPLEEAAKIMKRKDVGSLIVKDDERLKGIITEWDIVRKVVATGNDPKNTRVKDIMVTNVITISPNADIYDALVRMRNNDIRHLPVVQRGKLVGFITIKDILKIQPELFDILVDRWELREEEEKPLGERVASGTCNMCGKESSVLLDVNGMLVCRKCRQKIRKF
ncbi:inosine-5-monophosphate dehydrogenase [Candidatus Woesearchaeota archaeon]|nr:MAG: inosine-5-monophosphate dehydrogenase [Candidatus Woesearchaeota archaeon]